jgi:hypothetical protein
MVGIVDRVCRVIVEVRDPATPMGARGLLLGGSLRICNFVKVLGHDGSPSIEVE